MRIHEKLRMKKEEFRQALRERLDAAFFFLVFRWGFLKFQTTGSCSVAGHDPILAPSVGLRLKSGNLQGKGDVGLGDLKTERNMC